MIDNFEIILPLLSFGNEEDFYYLTILQRKKDHKEAFNAEKVVGSNNSSRIIKTYYIYSERQLLRYKPEMIKLAELFKARIQINLNKRNSKHVALEMLAQLAHNIKSNHTAQMSRLYDSICGQYHSDKDKKWILDVDDSGLMNPDISDFIDSLQPVGVKKTIAIIPSKNGFHIIAKPFDTRFFAEKYPEISLHKNNPTNVYIP